MELDPAAWPERRELRPPKRRGRRGPGEFEEMSWEIALDDIDGRIRRALLEKRDEEVVSHIGR